MRLINQSKNTVLAENVCVAGTLFKRMKGLLGRKTFLPNQAIILDPCNSVHTFFMRFSIDVLFLDKNYRVVKVLPRLLPNRITSICWGSKLVVELPSGTLELKPTMAQDQLKLID